MKKRIKQVHTCSKTFLNTAPFNAACQEFGTTFSSNFLLIKFRPILHKSFCLTDHSKCEVTVPEWFFLWERRLFWPSMEAEQRKNISVSPGTWTHDCMKPVFLVTHGNQRRCIIFSIFPGLILNLFSTCAYKGKWATYAYTKEIIQLSLQDIIIGVVTTKRPSHHLLTSYSLYANHW